VLILTVLQGPDKGRRFELPDDEPQQIGRSSEALPLKDETISRRHAELTPDDGRWYINDLKSANGTFVNGLRVTERRLLLPGDQVRTGSTLFIFGQEARMAQQRGVRVVKDDMGVHVQASVASNDDSMIMAVPEPGQAAPIQLRVIYELTQLIGTVVDHRRLLERVMDLIFEYFQADRGFILLQNTVDSRPEPVVVRHRLAPNDSKSGMITISQTIVQHVIRRGEGVLSSNAMTDKRFAGGDSVQRLGIRSAMCVPIKFKDQLFGVIHIDSQLSNYTYTEDQLRLLTAIGVQTGLALSNAQHHVARLHRERLAAVGQTVASLSHSIKNIIQGLRGGADVVELGLRKNNMKVVNGGWEIVSRNLERIFGLTMNMLTYSTNRRPELEMTHLSKLLEEIIPLVQTQYDRKNIALLTDFDQDMPPVPLDPSGIHQAVLNLLINALDAVEPESGVVSLRCDYDGKASRALIIVADNGQGMPPETARHIFKPFHSTKGLRGTGLGLVVTKKVVEEHGGRITVETSPETGTTFTIKLPYSPDAMADSDDTHEPISQELILSPFIQDSI